MPAEQDRIIGRLVSAGRFASAQEAVEEAIRRLEADEGLEYLHPRPLTAEEAAQVYWTDAIEGLRIFPWN